MEKWPKIFVPVLGGPLDGGYVAWHVDLLREGVEYRVPIPVEVLPLPLPAQPRPGRHPVHTYYLMVYCGTWTLVHT